MSWVEVTKSGTLRLCDRIKVNGKWKRVSAPLEKRTPQAIRKATEALERKARSIYQPESETALKSLIESYLETKDCRESTKINLRIQFGHVLEILGDNPISTYTPGSVFRAFYLSQKPPQTVNRAMIAFRTFARWLRDLEYTQEDLSARLRQIKEHKKEKPPEELYIEVDRLQEILDQLAGMPYYLTRFLALTGMRIGEATALTPGDIGDKYIHITKAYSSHSHEITEPKNATSNRDIYIQPELRALLDEFFQWRNLYIMSKGIRPEQLFCSASGSIYQERYYRAQLYKFGVHPHMLRHTHVAILAEQGMTLEAIARRLGHAGTETTKRVYYHVTQKQREKDEAAMSAIRIFAP